jgi:uncharacterized membrane protein YeaQ/YmgE (transglycosylase-associated protein family)
VVGVAGSFVGGTIGSLIFGAGCDVRPSGLVGSILGATVVLAAYQALKRRQQVTER